MEHSLALRGEETEEPGEHLAMFQEAATAGVKQLLKHLHVGLGHLKGYLKANSPPL